MKKIFTFFLIMLTFICSYTMFNLEVGASTLNNESSAPKDNYVLPAISGVVYENELDNNANSGIMLLSTSTKDEYENNNSFEDAKLMFNSNPELLRTESGSIYASIHKEPWYYLFWRDIDEDYFYFNAYGNARLTITLTNVPANFDYDIELYMHPNETNSSFDDLRDEEPIAGSYKKYNNNELIDEYITPGTYYIRVYSYDGYSGDYDYKINYTLSYENQDKSISISDLRYNKGAKAAIWRSDFDPFGYTPFSMNNKQEVGYLMTYPYMNNYTNPFHNYLNQRADNEKIEHSVIYIWDKEWRSQIRMKLIDMKSKLQTEIDHNNELILKCETVQNYVNGVFIGIDYLLFIFEGPELLGTISSVGNTLSSAIIPLFFPIEWNTNKEELVNYIDVLCAALECDENTSDNEVVMIKTAYKYSEKIEYIPRVEGDYNYGFGSDYSDPTIIYETHITYYIDFTPTVNIGGENFLFNEDEISFYNNKGYMYGEVYGIRNINDIKSYINNEELPVLNDTNTSEPTEIFLEDSYSDNLNEGQYFWYMFKAPYTGKYTFSSQGAVDILGELFNSTVNAQSISNRIKYDDNSGVASNFCIEHDMNADEIIYLRIRGANWIETGPFSFEIDYEVIQTENMDLDVFYSNTILNGNEHWYQFTAQESGDYKFYTTGSIDTYGEIFSMPVVNENENGIIKKDDDSGDSLNFEIIYNMNSGDTIYIRVKGYSINTNGNYSFIVKKIEGFNIILDPSNKTSLGTEVTMNNGEYNCNIITIGYTRNAYLDTNAPSSSRLDYYWSTSNSNIAKVSNYGTITAKSPGTVIITARYKNDSTYIGHILVNVIADTSSTIKHLSFTTDMREAPKAAGTEVTSNGGLVGEFVIHTGFTRFICFSDDAPSALIQDYVWSSSNSSVLYVDEYGIVYARNVTEPTLVTITCVYKYNKLFTGTITFEVYPNN